MLNRGIRIPCVWEHQPGAHPVELSYSDRIANYVKHCFAEAGATRIGKDGVLWVRHDVYDPADARKLKTAEVQVSPKLLNGFSDPKGREYRGTTVAHIAATPTPVQYWQSREWLAAPPLSRELSSGNALFLSYGSSSMPKPKDDDLEQELETEVAPEGEEAPPPEPELPAGPEGDLAGLVDALREYGLTIPDECEDIKHLIIAIKAAKPAGGDPDGMNASAGKDAAIGQGGGPPMLMSDARTIEKYTKAERKGLKNEVRELYLAGRINRVKRLELDRRIDAVEMSFYDSGDLAPNKVAAEVEALKTLPANSAWKPTGAISVELSNTAIEPHPESLTKEAPGIKEATAAILSRIPSPTK